MMINISGGVSARFVRLYCVGMVLQSCRRTHYVTVTLGRVEWDNTNLLVANSILRRMTKQDTGTMHYYATSKSHATFSTPEAAPQPPPNLDTEPSQAVQQSRSFEVQTGS
jgi:hypothetical protein